MKRCTRCILPENFPNIDFDQQGMCSYCNKWDKKWKNFDYKKSEMELVSLFKWAKAKKREYDCLIPFSGGRDSSFVAWLCKNKYGLKPLLVTFNNLFLSDYGVQNILNGVEILDCDHIILGFQPDLLKKFYRTMVLKAGEFCSICACGINYTVVTVQKKYNIPLVVWGRSSRVDENSPFDVTCSHPLYVWRTLSAGGIDSREIASLLVKRPSDWVLKDKIKAKLTGNDYMEINLPDFIPWKIRQIEDVLRNELKWGAPSSQDDHIDCKFAPVKTYLKNKQIPHFVFKQEKYSQLIRDGQMARDEAIKKLNKLMADEAKEPPELEFFIAMLGLKRTDIERVGQVSHKDFIREDEIFRKESLMERMVYKLWQVIKKAI